MNSDKPCLAQACIYLDNAATTALDRRVLAAMLAVMAEGQTGNAHARHHVCGANSHNLAQMARRKVAESIGAHEGEIVFTSGATEANNLAIKGMAGHLRATGKMHIVTSAVEHASVLEPLKTLATQGFELSVLGVKPCAMIEADMIERALRPDTGLVCVQAVNNEVGVIQPLEEIAAMLGGRDVLLHCDAAQALGKTRFSVDNGVDFASLSAHKVYGPQGIGALFVRQGKRSLLQPINSGGGQEAGLRSGTLPLALCVGFGQACSLIEDDAAHLRALRSKFLSRIEGLRPIVYGHSLPEWNVPGILNIRFPGIDSETLTMALPELAFGIGAACSSGGTKLSQVVRAATGSEEAARESLRLSFGRFTTDEEISRAADLIIVAVENIRALQGVA